jgi:HEAT repeat protein
VFALGYLGKGVDEAVPALLRAMDDTQPQVRHEAVGALGLLKARAAVPAIVAMLREGDRPYLRVRAALALAQIGPDAEEARSALLDQLGRDDDLARVSALALVAVSDEVPPAVWAALLEAVLSEHYSPRSSLWLLRDRGAPLAAKLVEALAQGDTARRQRAIESLQNLGPAARAARPALERLRDDAVVGDAARQALARIGTEDAPGR